MDINTWLSKFETCWKAKEVEKIIDLFDENVEYWETPFKKITSRDELAKEWKAIINQENLVISMTLFNSEQNKHSVVWAIAYNSDDQLSAWSGVYLIELNNSGLCKYFHQVGEQK